MGRNNKKLIFATFWFLAIAVGIAYAATFPAGGPAIPGQPIVNPLFPAGDGPNREDFFYQYANPLFDRVSAAAGAAVLASDLHLAGLTEELQGLVNFIDNKKYDTGHTANYTVSGCTYGTGTAAGCAKQIANRAKGRHGALMVEADMKSYGYAMAEAIVGWCRRCSPQVRMDKTYAFMRDAHYDQDQGKLIGHYGGCTDEKQEATSGSITGYAKVISNPRQHIHQNCIMAMLLRVAQMVTTDPACDAAGDKKEACMKIKVANESQLEEAAAAIVPDLQRAAMHTVIKQVNGAPSSGTDTKDTDGQTINFSGPINKAFDDLQAEVIPPDGSGFGEKGTRDLQMFKDAADGGVTAYEAMHADMYGDADESAVANRIAAGASVPSILGQTTGVRP